jgi:glycerol-3-phosphate dehydrogenase (NAD(P)+)
MWAREREVANALTQGRGNPLYLPGVDLPPIPARAELSALSDCDALLAVVPAQFARATYAQLRQVCGSGVAVALCSKGVEQGTGSLQTEVLADAWPEASPAVLSGPSFAADVARGLPTAVTLACANPAEAEAWLAAVGSAGFRPYRTDDLIGAEVGGAVKNVLAIACGVVLGLGLGRSAHAALIARGFAEMSRLALAMGGRADTLAGLSGLGDLVLTCSSEQSRNMSFGFALGQGRKPADILAERTAVTEGVATAPPLRARAAHYGVDMPICAGVDDLLAGRASVGEVVDRLMNRPFREEIRLEG